ncbi:TPA: hypothetical protein ACP31J_006058 [Pseudomonas aeruginosa]|uniref:hypothetical protein n=1 Tax=Pseudomonas aeruginosa TaxID=287 RepID=UPI001C3F0A98|nr:hypothetical protein [Pseudomonas aeruginosa]MBV5800260.1 hypothetical protein [Pseudomonas aeruginosa]MCV3852312.1 hypothetical protein [Pseudomonas aeruginosa]MCV3858343.1 hypothetical protein [Pseudomonas aeruginosa]MDU0746517.1 hypothetical protein [Pseudomonas aeruginosa]MDU0758758.1 hypothetical protein [Pseudomonas aeruginosa]
MISLKNRKHSRIVSSAAAVMALLAGAYILVLVNATKWNQGGTRPDEKLFGTVKSYELAHMEQSCTGVMKTPRATWLVGRIEGRDFERLASRDLQGLNPINIDAIVDDNAEDFDAIAVTEGKQEVAVPSLLIPGMRRSRITQRTFISKLDEAGNFRLVATVGDSACLTASADGAHLFLLTDLRRPDGDDRVWQTAVFRSDDQGNSWQWLQEGFFPQLTPQAAREAMYEAHRPAKHRALELRPYFFPGGHTWVWEEPDGDTLLYSPDLGKTIARVETRQLVAFSEEELKRRLPKATYIHNEGATRTIQQLDDDHAVGWWSDRFAARDSSRSFVGSYSVAIRLQFSRKDGEWRVTDSERHDGIYLDKVAHNPNGDFYAVIERDYRRRGVVGRYNPDARKWEELGELPNEFWPLDSYTGLRSNAQHTFSVGRHSMVATVDSAYVPPLIFTALSPRLLSSEGHYYSTDGGKNWTKLGLNSYLSVFGFDPEHDRIIGTRGDRYDEVEIFSYGLAPSP